MSLISTASVWTNDDATPKKRIPTMRKTIKKMPSEHEEYTSESQNYNEYKQNTMEDTKKKMENRNERVNEIINQLNENNHNEPVLSDFKPLPNTVVQSKQGFTSGVGGGGADVGGGMGFPEQRKNNVSTPFSSNNMSLANLSHYGKSYETPVLLKNKPYYKNFGIGTHDEDNKLMEKINYMVHMLEDMQGEKTNNIAEEFILYSLLGIFMIFLVDSFSKTTKYVR